MSLDMVIWYNDLNATHGLVHTAENVIGCCEFKIITMLNFLHLK